MTSRTELLLICFDAAQLADPFFRRQILVQMLILFQYLLSFVPSERARVLEFTTNVAALPNYTLSAGNVSLCCKARNLLEAYVAVSDAGKMDPRSARKGARRDGQHGRRRTTFPTHDRADSAT